MSLLISAPIRTGKTLKAMELCYEYLNKSRQVYTNIIGIKIPGVISVSSDIGEPYDWRNLPNGSVLIWDEAHEHPAFSEQDLLKNYKIDETPFDHLLSVLNREPNITPAKIKENTATVEKRKKEALERKKEEIRDIGRALLMHGHHGIEIIFITQRPSKLNPDVLASVTTHFVMRRKFGMDAAIIWEFGEAMTSWSRSTAATALNKTLWRYPKHLYKFYVSSENHQVRKSFPLKYAAFGLVPLAIFGLATKNSMDTGFFGFWGKKEQQHVAQTQGTQPDTGDKVICNQANAYLPQCKDLLDRVKPQTLEQGDGIKTQITNVVYYNPNDPYATVTSPVQQLNNVDFPRVSGCIKYAGKYHAIDQQGNLMPQVNQQVCKRWLEDGERPFDYFRKEQQQYQQQQPVRVQQKPQQDVKQFDAEYIARIQEAKQQGLI
ncbi:zonular occludens toxin domain-containing protein [Acinetobacter sp. C26M]|uniref:zonular occludens toxin domain-containing protein n=1 Tax=unclassified Acinetobacter TaxID=196816 RepID=UPI002036B26B|nr:MULTISPECIES: zonular occludens toxin domain-containing protein [unclassified Acinetobacter]USA44940.1 zonular occludens toxin domain-containing protein [Acinetobacter sp. C26M]USA48443.1 zonular occludens toxin domain-containing protein [Acinetobacter sp. C26G]